MTLKNELFAVMGHSISGKDLILILGGLFLLFKSTHEIHNKIEGDDDDELVAGGKRAAFGAVLVQIAVLDIVFSLDSVITAVGMADQILVMVLAVIIAVIFMMVFSGSVSAFISKHPTVKMLALSFLLLIGTALVAEGFHVHFPKGYVYFAMAFSVMVEMLNLKTRKKSV
jgi:predicted tellurium resistance membrane protein TerC